MIQSSKMASLGEMSAGVSHEINNPLAIIQGSAFRAIQNLEAADPSNWLHHRDDVEGDLNRIIQNCDRIARIVRGLRAFSRSAEHEPFMPTPLSSVIDDVMNLAFERFVNHRIKMHIDLAEIITLDCRPVQLGQVLMNLLNNAYDAVIENDESKREVWVQAMLEGEVVVISVEDSGHGIPLSLHNRILEPFFTTKDVGRGTGLGLSISKGIIESHSGRLWLDPSSERTRFVIELPLHQVP
jgi:C4-dicarboxylate-specific signal transduction histidine kinase